MNSPTDQYPDGETLHQKIVVIGASSVAAAVAVGWRGLSKVLCEHYQGSILAEDELSNLAGLESGDIMPPVFDAKMVENRSRRAYTEHRLKRGNGHNRFKRRK